jgi:hypothetical protein
MSGTAHGDGTAGRVGACAAGMVLLLAGCGGTDYTSGSTATHASKSTAPVGAAEFCSQAADIDDRVDAAVADLGDDPSIPAAFRRLTAELRAIDAPAPIAADWETMAGGLERMADAFADVDLTDPSSLAALDAAAGDVSAASDRVDTYLHDECGITS